MCRAPLLYAPRLSLQQILGFASFFELLNNYMLIFNNRFSGIVVGALQSFGFEFFSLSPWCGGTSTVERWRMWLKTLDLGSWALFKGYDGYVPSTLSLHHLLNSKEQTIIPCFHFELTLKKKKSIMVDGTSWQVKEILLRNF